MLLVMPMLLSFAVRRALWGANRAVMGSSQALALIPGIAGQYLRTAFLRVALAHCAPTATVEFGTIFSDAGARLGEHSYIGPMCHIGLADVGDDALVGAAVHIPSGPATHGIADLDKPIRDQPGDHVMVHVGRGAWIGSAAIVMADVGAGAIVAAGAVVTRAVPDFAVAAGVPARVIRNRRADGCESSS